MRVRAADAVLGAGIVLGYLDIVLMQIRGGEGFLGPLLVLSLIMVSAAIAAAVIGMIANMLGSIDGIIRRQPQIIFGLCGVILSFPLWQLCVQLSRAPGISLGATLGAATLIMGAGYWWGRWGRSPGASVLGAFVSGLLLSRAINSVDLMERVDPGVINMEWGLILGATITSFAMATALVLLLQADEVAKRPWWVGIGGVAGGIFIIWLAQKHLSETYTATQQVVYCGAFLIIAFGLSGMLTADMKRRNRLMIIGPAVGGVLWILFGISPLDQGYVYMRSAPLAKEILRETGLTKNATRRLLAELKEGVDTTWEEPERREVPAEIVERDLSVLLITVDTLRYDYTGYSGLAAEGLTPNMDRLASRSQRFHRAYAPAGITVLSLSTLFWSKNPANIRFDSMVRRSGRRFYLEEDLPEGRAITRRFVTPLGDPDQSVAEVLSARGLRTIAVANDENLHFFSSGMGFTRGFEEEHYMSLVYEERFGVEPGNPDLIDGFTVDIAQEVLEKIDDEQFFMWVHLFSPHLPHREHEGVDFEGYEGEVHYMDQQLGRILEQLEEQGRVEDTVIVFTADHGEELGDYGVTGHGTNISERNIRVPLLVYIPGVAGQDIRATEAGLIDITPTVLDLLGADIPRSMDGYSLWGAIQDEGAWSRPPIRIENWAYYRGTFYKHKDLVGLIKDGVKVVIDKNLNTLEYYDVSIPGREIEVTGLEPGTEEWERFSRVAATLVEWVGEL